MEIQEFLRLIKNKKQTIAIVTIIFVLIAVAFTFVQPLRYSSVSKVLIVQALPEGIDPYQVSKSNEYVASLLTQVISTNSFFKEVLNSGFNIDENYFPESGDRQMKLWKKTVKASSNSNGIITIKVYHDNRVQVNQISQAINFILKTKHGLYHGFGDLVTIKIIEQPVISDRPIKPNVFVNISVALSFGILVSLTYIYLFPQSHYDLHLTPKVKRHMASDDISPGHDEFEINNQRKEAGNSAKYYNNTLNSINNTSSDLDKKLNKNKSAITSNEDLDVYNKLRRAVNAPSDLPIVDEINELEAENKNILVNQKPRDITKQGSMDNIIKQSDQRD